MDEPADTPRPGTQTAGAAFKPPRRPKPGAPVVAALLALILSGCTEDVNETRDVHGAMELHRVAQSGDVASVEALLQQGASANVQDLDGVTALHRAARDGNLAVVETLIRHHADLNMRTKDGWDALQLAAHKGHADVVKLLLSYGAMTTRKTPQGWTALHLAALKGNVDVADVCLLNWPSYEETGRPSLDEPDEKGTTPLMLAFQHGHMEMVEYLLAKGADPDATDAKGNTLLHLLAGAEDTELASRLVLFYKADVNRRNQGAQTPYAAAMGSDNKKLAKLLWDNGGR